MFTNIKIMPRHPKESYSEYAYRILRQNIMELNLPPGSNLNEGNLAKLLNVSRTPVHEAVNKLKEENLVDIIPRKESRISLINISLVKEGVFMRCALEPEIVKFVAGNISVDYIKKFQQNLDLQKEIISRSDKRDLNDFYAVDDEFHKMIYEIANKANIYKWMKKVVSHFDRIRYFISVEGFFEIEDVSYQEHKELFNILMFGLTSDINIENFLKNHIMRYQRYISVLVEKYPQYFIFA